MALKDHPRPVVRRRRKSDEKPPMPAVLKPIAEKAKERHRKRHENPGVEVTVERLSGAYVIDSPHRDRDSWEAMICEAVGTRSAGHAKTFLAHLAELCTKAWHPNDGENAGGEWYPDENEMNMVLNFVAGVKPRNEMEAALAAQMVAVHLMTMKASQAALQGWGVDERTAALAGKLARTFTMQIDAMAKLKGRKTTRQKITVSYERHDHKHVHFEGGVSESEGRPHATGDGASVGVGKSIEGACQLAERPAVQGAATGRQAVSIRCGQGAEGLPDAWRGPRIRRAKG